MFYSVLNTPLIVELFLLDLAWIGSMGYSMSLFVGCITSVLCDRIGCGYVMSLGGVFVSLGIITSSIATNTWILFITYGLLLSLGTSCLFFSSLISLPFYFKRRLGLANGIASSGSGIGGLTFSPLLDYLIRHYGLRKTFQIYSIFSLLPLIGGFIMRRRPIKKDKEPKEKQFSQFVDLELIRNKAFLIFTLAMSLILFAYYIPIVHLVSMKNCFFIYIYR